MSIDLKAATVDFYKNLHKKTDDELAKEAFKVIHYFSNNIDELLLTEACNSVMSGRIILINKQVVERGLITNYD